MIGGSMTKYEFRIVDYKGVTNTSFIYALTLSQAWIQIVLSIGHPALCDIVEIEYVK
jgi:hypothetical protein